MKTHVCILALALVSWAPNTGAQTLEETTSQEDIVVVGERVHDMVVDFVTELAVAPSGERQMARWSGAICPTIAGISRRHAQYMADRLAARAHEVGVSTGGPDCDANIAIFVTPDADVLAETIVSDFRNAVGYYSNAGISTLGREALDEFRTTSAPVRWWHVNQTVDAQGQSSSVLRSHQSSTRLRRLTQQAFRQVIIIVDARQADGVGFQALSDYVAMIALAQLDPSGEPSGVPSILNLFAERRAGLLGEGSLTEWDLAYLEGLYHARMDAPRDVWQRRDIVRRMEIALNGVRE